MAKKKDGGLVKTNPVTVKMLITGIATQIDRKAEQPAKCEDVSGLFESAAFIKDFDALAEKHNLILTALQLQTDPIKEDPDAAQAS